MRGRGWVVCVGATSLAAVAGALGAAVPAGRSASRPAPLKPIPPKISFSASSGVARAVGGVYRVGGKRRSFTYVYEYTLADQGGNTCGAMSRGTGRSFTLKLSPYRLKARFGLQPVGGNRPVWGTWQNFDVGGRGLQCQQLTASTLPSARQLCSWDGNFPTIGGSGACGIPSQNACAWASPATLRDGTVSMGSIACPVSPCGILGSRHTVTWFTPTPVAIASVMTCGDLQHVGYSTSVTGPGQAADPGLALIQFGHYDANHQVVIDCEAGPAQFHGIGVTSFVIPDGVGGVLRVAFVLIPLQPRGDGALVAGGRYEYETSQFDLPGSQSGCPLNLAPINP